MKYSWNVVWEVMRLAPPAPGGFKQAMADFTYAGYRISKGCKLCWSSTATHKNPEYFPDPDKFDPSRFQGDGPAPFTYVPFAGGPGTSAGKEYVRVQILVFVHHLVRRYKIEKSIPLNPKDEEKLIFKPFPLLTKGLPICIRAH
ncbi:beta-amyrin 28-monooxygenase-like [Papaver somniferum]|uniref:beta-amyrin 28-monooxygenase-like n=1 Tax=Papaver somniferum TaxID=3469 RepID=UPI000E6FA367|nr:beta-amyrin 28-monooxygenase-like [Papaver somniferum]